MSLTHIFTPYISSTDGLAFDSAHRREVLYYFVQVIFLLFAATYIAKESLEHMLVAEAHGHGSHHHAQRGAILVNDKHHAGIANHRYATIRAERELLSLQTDLLFCRSTDTSMLLLLVACASTITSGVTLQNHRKLVNGKLVEVGSL